MSISEACLLAGFCEFPRTLGSRLALVVWPGPIRDTETLPLLCYIDHGKNNGVNPVLVFPYWNVPEEPPRLGMFCRLSRFQIPDDRRNKNVGLPAHRNRDTVSPTLWYRSNLPSAPP